MHAQSDISVETKKSHPLYLYIGYVFPLDDIINVICIVNQFGSVNPTAIPKKVRWFIVCMQCECKSNRKHKQKENMDMMSQTTQLEINRITSNSSINPEDMAKKGNKKEESISTNPQSVTNPSINNPSSLPSIDTVVESC